MAATNLTTTLNGAIQRYLRKAFFDLPMEVFRTPLVNSPLGIKANIPKNQGQKVQWRFFEQFTPDGVLFAESAEPASSETLTSTTVEAPIQELVRFISLGHLLVDTDLIDILRKSRNLMATVARRDAHILATIRFVQPATISAFGSTFTNTPYKTIFAGRLNQFGDLGSDSFHRMRDWKRARSLMSNAQVPTDASGLYTAIIDPGIKDELREDDKDFREIVKRDGQMRKTVFGMARMVDYEGIRWIMHDDSYRAALPGEGGALNTRVARGAVHVGHLVGPGTYGWLQLGGKRIMNPNFKVQDITVTGIETTLAYRIPYQAIVVRNDWGVNVAGTSRFSENIDDI